MKSPDSGDGEAVHGRGDVLRGALLTGCRAGSCAKGVSAPRVFYLLLAGATALEREELVLPDSAAVAVCTKAGESLQREDVPSRAKAFGQLREHLRRARAHLEPRE